MNLLLLSLEDFLLLGKNSVGQYLKHILQHRYFVALKYFRISHCLGFNHAARSRLLGNSVPSCRREQASVFGGLLNLTSGSYGIHLHVKPSTLCVRVVGSGKLLLFCCFLLSHLWAGSQPLAVSPPPLPPHSPNSVLCVWSAPVKSEAAILQLVQLWNLVTSYSAAKGVSKLVVKQRKNELFPKCCRNGFLWNLLSFILMTAVIYAQRRGF